MNESTQQQNVATVDASEYDECHTKPKFENDGRAKGKENFQNKTKKKKKKNEIQKTWQLFFFTYSVRFAVFISHYCNLPSMCKLLRK